MHPIHIVITPFAVQVCIFLYIATLVSAALFTGGQFVTSGTVTFSVISVIILVMSSIAYLCYIHDFFSKLMNTYMYE